jgi:DNA-binding NarL/FixJ family response regulator
MVSLNPLPASAVIAVAICSMDRALRSRLEHLVRSAPTLALAGLAESSQAAIELIDRHHVDVLLTDVDALATLQDGRETRGQPFLIAIVQAGDHDEALEALSLEADGVLPRSAGRREILAAIQSSSNRLAVIPRELLDVLLGTRSAAPAESSDRADAESPALTKRELEVLAAMADGASNKTIARLLGISFHTVKFHVAAVLTKLDADTRTEAVAKAAHLGLVML